MTIAVRDLAWVRYQAPDLDAMESFLVDFGLRRAHRCDDELGMCAAGSTQPVHITQRGPARSIGFALQAASADDVQRLAEATGRGVEPADAFGGVRVTLQDPGGLQVEVVHLPDARPAQPQREPVPVNSPGTQRRLNRTVRLESGASQVLRAGHVALLVPDFPAAYDFYTGVLGLRLTDGYSAGPDGPLIAGFLHCGLGSAWVDHHTVALVTVPGLLKGRIEHSAFEVVDFDEVMRGHHHLLARGRRPSWGVGRHYEGSQVFDYWRDPWGHKVEHWTDGDLVNDETAAQVRPMEPGRLAQWAPPLAPEFFE